MKQSWYEKLMLFIIVVLFVLSFSFSINTFTGTTFVHSLIYREHGNNGLVFCFVLFSLMVATLVLLYPNKSQIVILLEKVLNPSLRKIFLKIVNGRLERVKEDKL